MLAPIITAVNVATGANIGSYLLTPIKTAVKMGDAKTTTPKNSMDNNNMRQNSGGADGIRTHETLPGLLP